MTGPVGVSKASDREDRIDTSRITCEAEQFDPAVQMIGRIIDSGRVHVGSSGWKPRDRVADNAIRPGWARRVSCRVDSAANGANPREQVLGNSRLFSLACICVIRRQLFFVRRRQMGTSTICMHQPQVWLFPKHRPQKSTVKDMH